MELDIVNNNNEKVGALTVSDEVFGGRVNGDLIWESVVHENARSVMNAGKVVATRSALEKLQEVLA